MRRILEEGRARDDYLEIGLGRCLAVEPARRSAARHLLARLRRRLPHQPALRQEPRTVLAASLHESRALDHRTVPALAGGLGHAAGHLPLHGGCGNCSAAENRRGSSDLLADRLCPVRAVISRDHRISPLTRNPSNEWGWIYTGARLRTRRLASSTPSLRDRLKPNSRSHTRRRRGGGGAGSEFREQVEAIERWYLHDWTALDAKLRTSIVEGISGVPLALRPAAASPACSARRHRNPDASHIIYIKVTMHRTRTPRPSGPCRASAAGCRRSPS